MIDHQYEWCGPAKCHVCRKCGTAKHKSCWWFAGRKYDAEPPCLNYGVKQETTHD